MDGRHGHGLPDASVDRRMLPDWRISAIQIDASYAGARFYRTRYGDRGEGRHDSDGSRAGVVSDRTRGRHSSLRMDRRRISRTTITTTFIAHTTNAIKNKEKKMTATSSTQSNEKEIVITREFAAPRQLVWD